MLASLATKLLNGLALVGRFGTQGFAASIVVGLALPQLAAICRPLLPLTIFLFLVITFARANLTTIGGLLQRPAKLIGACAWLIVAPAALVLAAIACLGRGTIDPGLLLGLALLGASPPIMSSPAVAILYGFEPSLIIAAVFAVTILAPLTAPPLADFLAGAVVPLDATALALRLVVFIGGGLLVGVALRVVAGAERIVRLRQSLDGAGVVLYFIFAFAAMDGVTTAMLNRPGTVALFLAIAFTISFSGLAASLALLRQLPAEERFMVGYGTGNRNLGLLVAALGAGVPDTTFLFFALAQFPVYLMPQLLRPVARYMARRQHQAAVA